MRAINIKTQYRPKFDHIYYLLKEGKLVEYRKEKDKIIKEWKEIRYRVCLECGKQKLRSMFDGQSKRCKQCKINIKRNTKKINRERHKDYIRTGQGLENWCAKQVVYNLKKMGILKPTKCQICGAYKVEAHHINYNKPWEVVWLCRKCHLEWHKNNKCIYVKK